MLVSERGFENCDRTFASRTVKEHRFPSSHSPPTRLASFCFTIAYSPQLIRRTNSSSNYQFELISTLASFFSPTPPLSPHFVHLSPSFSPSQRMPYVSLPGSVELYYEQPHSPHDYSSKPSLVLLAPSWTNIFALEPYVEALQSSYNLTLLELRSHGRTKNPVVAEWDYWCSAADIAFAMVSSSSGSRLARSRSIGGLTRVCERSRRKRSNYLLHMYSLQVDQLFKVCKRAPLYSVSLCVS